MSILIRFKNGCLTFTNGLKFIYEHRLWSYIVLPCLASFVLGAGVWLAVYFGFDYLSDWGTSLLTEGTLQLRNPILLGIIEWSSAILGMLLALILTLVLYRSLISIVVVPFLGPLVEQIETILLGKKIETTVRQDLLNLSYGLWTSIVHSIAGLFILLLSLCLGPFNIPINVIAQSYFLGRGPFDMLFEKAADSHAERGALKRAWRAEIFGAGLVFFVVLLLPLIGALIAPVSVVSGAAVLYYSSDNRKV
ncbi:MAG: EI24 domain-containing protein [bacterium]|nr:EI24 domain-containing protein [bacterium]